MGGICVERSIWVFITISLSIFIFYSLLVYAASDDERENVSWFLFLEDAICQCRSRDYHVLDKCFTYQRPLEKRVFRRAKFAFAMFRDQFLAKQASLRF